MDYEVARSLSSAIEKAIKVLPITYSVTSYLDQVSVLVSTDEGLDTYLITITQEE